MRDFFLFFFNIERYVTFFARPVKFSGKFKYQRTASNATKSHRAPRFAVDGPAGRDAFRISLIGFRRVAVNFSLRYLTRASGG